jgi:hypothetical protein
MVDTTPSDDGEMTLTVAESRLVTQTLPSPATAGQRERFRR